MSHYHGRRFQQAPPPIPISEAEQQLTEKSVRKIIVPQTAKSIYLVKVPVEVSNERKTKPEGTHLGSIKMTSTDIKEYGELVNKRKREAGDASEADNASGSNLKRQGIIANMPSPYANKLVQLNLATTSHTSNGLDASGAKEREYRIDEQDFGDKMAYCFSERFAGEITIDGRAKKRWVLKPVRVSEGYRKTVKGRTEDAINQKKEHKISRLAEDPKMDVGQFKVKLDKNKQILKRERKTDENGQRRTY